MNDPLKAGLGLAGAALVGIVVTYLFTSATETVEAGVDAAEAARIKGVVEKMLTTDDGKTFGQVFQEHADALNDLAGSQRELALTAVAEKQAADIFREGIRGWQAQYVQDQRIIQAALLELARTPGG